MPKPPTGDDLIALARTRVNQRYVLGAFVPKSSKHWNGPWDCAEFASWLVFQVSGTLFGTRPSDLAKADVADAYTGYWAEDATKHSARISVEEAAATPGAFVLRAPAPGAIGHIVLSVGDGTTLEAMSASKGVRAGKLAHRRWDCGVLVPGIQTIEGAPVALAPPGRVLYLGAPRNPATRVRAVQRRLKELGYTPGPIDGQYGPQTAAAVRAFQIDRKLVPDGETGPQTARALNIEWPVR